MVKSGFTCFLAGTGEDWGTGEGVSMGLLAPEPEPEPATDVLSDVDASDGWTPEELLGAAELA